MKKIFFIILVVAIIINLFAGCSNTTKDNVTIEVMGSYYNVILDFTNGASHRQIGEEYGEAILMEMPTYEAVVDTYINYITNGSLYLYELYIKRVHDIMPQLDQDYIDEIEGIASNFSGEENTQGDDQVSLDEMFLFNLVPDVCRAHQCSAVAVYGDLSETGHTMTGRILEWHDQVKQLNAIITYKNGEHSICSIGFLGYQGIITGVNDNKMFVGILDDVTFGTYDSKDKRSYVFDLRHALENFDTIYDLAAYMISVDHQYAFSHLIIISDKNVSKVIENNFSAQGCRLVREEDSELFDGVTWDINHSIGCVNAHISEEHLSTTIMYPGNGARWDKMKEELISKGDSVTAQELKEVISYWSGNEPRSQIRGDLYTNSTIYLCLYNSETNELECFFAPKNEPMPVIPEFVSIPLEFE